MASSVSSAPLENFEIYSKQEPQHEKHWQEASRTAKRIACAFALTSDFFYIVGAILIIIGSSFIVSDTEYYAITGANIFVAGDLCLFFAGVARILLDTILSVSISGRYLLRVMFVERLDLLCYMIADLFLTASGLLFFIGGCLASYPAHKIDAYSVWDAGVACFIVGAALLLLADVGALFFAAQQPERAKWTKYWLYVVSAILIFFASIVIAVGTCTYLYEAAHWIVFGNICWIVGSSAIILGISIRVFGDVIL